jgi:hypothetical protein
VKKACKVCTLLLLYYILVVLVPKLIGFVWPHAGNYIIEGSQKGRRQISATRLQRRTTVFQVRMPTERISYLVLILIVCVTQVTPDIPFGTWIHGCCPPCTKSASDAMDQKSHVGNNKPDNFNFCSWYYEQW